MKRCLPALLVWLLVSSLLLQACGRAAKRGAEWGGFPQTMQSGQGGDMQPAHVTAPVPGTDGSPKPFATGTARTEPSSSPTPPPPVSPLPTAAPKPNFTQPPAPKPKPKPKPAPKPASADEKVTAEAEKAAKAGKAGSAKAKTWTQLAVQYPGSFVLHGGSKAKRIALTFDDAPDERFTVPILNVLREHQVKATFFIIGSLAQKHPELVKRIKREGHVIGNHSTAHAYLPKMTIRQFEREINESERLLETIVGYKPRLFRPPYGAINEEQLHWASEHHMMVVNWNIDSLDWRGLSADEVVRNVMGNVGSGAIVLQHAGIGSGGNLSGTVEALPIIIRELKRKGYELVTLPELLGVSKEL